MRPQLLVPKPVSEARLLLLIDTFTSSTDGLDGRVKLAKLDFFLRYPKYLRKGLEIRKPKSDWSAIDDEGDTFEQTMIRYRYGPWDPGYYEILGRLVGKGLVTSVPTGRGTTYRTTNSGQLAASELARSESWSAVSERCRLLKRHFNLTGNSLKRFIYENFPEITDAKWGERL